MMRRTRGSTGEDVVRTAGFEQHGKTVIAKQFHQRQEFFWKQGFRHP